MIKDLTHAFKMTRYKLISVKKEYVSLIIEYVSTEVDIDFCPVCRKKQELQSISADNKTDLFQKSLTSRVKLCVSCQKRLHSNPPCFAMDIKIDDAHSKYQKYLMLISGIYVQMPDAFVDPIYDYNIAEIENLFNSIYDKISQGSLYDVENNIEEPFLKKLAYQYQSMLKKRQLREIFDQELKYRIDVVEEQLIFHEDIHRKLVEDGKFDEAKSFQELYFLLYEYKIKLVERLFRKTFNYENF